MAINIIFIFFCFLLPCCLAEEEPTRLPPLLIIHRNGTIERDNTILSLPFGMLVPPSPNDTQTGVSSKDITIIPTTNVTARIYLPKLTNPSEKIPILLHFHGGGFCIGSPFAKGDFDYLNHLSSQANILVVSVNYRLFPDYQLPTAYIDAWSALKWVASQKCGGAESWIVDHGDFTKIFVAGDSAGGNIAHNVIVWAGKEKLPNDVNVVGAILATPLFFGSKPLASESTNIIQPPVDQVWKYVCPSCEGGIDSPYLNPFGPGAPSLTQLGCKKLMVFVAEKDSLRSRGVWYYEGIKASGWTGEAFLYEGKGVDHVFQIANGPEHPETKKMIERVVEFVKN
ncbi:hypothetical protein Ancab_022247 [Ancistrocladus abbreviatus]